MSSLWKTLIADETGCELKSPPNKNGIVISLSSAN
jgi:hypothetical protein